MGAAGAAVLRSLQSPLQIILLNYYLTSKIKRTAFPVNALALSKLYIVSTDIFSSLVVLLRSTEALENFS